jgi:hypothetical protein
MVIETMIVQIDGTGVDYPTRIIEFWQAECGVSRNDSPAYFNSGGPDETKDAKFNADHAKANFFYLSWSEIPKCHIDGPPIYRACNVPNGNRLLIPIVSVLVSDKERPGASDTELNQLVVRDQEYVQKGPGPFVELDGEPFDMTGYEVITEAFDVDYPSDAIWNNPHNPNATISDGTSRAVAGGHYLITTPLSPGVYTVHFGGAVLVPGNQDCIENHYEENVKYVLYVQPPTP